MMTRMLKWLALAVIGVLAYRFWPRRRRWFVADPRIAIRPLGKPVVLKGWLR